jgi:quercetin dioxygenase-like cupin family protein
MAFKRGEELPVHVHSVAHASFICAGSFRVFDGSGKNVIMRQGTSVLFPPGRAHGFVALEDGVIFQLYEPGVTDG